MKIYVYFRAARGGTPWVFLNTREKYAAEPNPVLIAISFIGKSLSASKRWTNVYCLNIQGMLFR